MDPQQIREIFIALKLELLRFKEWCVIIFIGAASIVLTLGIFWPQSYKTSVVLYADVTNIIEPLLRGRAEVTKVDRSQTARDVIYTRRFAENVALESGVVKDKNDTDALDSAIKHIRAAVKIEPVGKDYFRIVYSANDQDQSFDILNKVVGNFIEYTAKQKKDESYSAYKFIDSQVQAYKKQLEEAENKLKEFKSANVDGTEATVSQRINELRNQIESLTLSIEEDQSRIRTINAQLSNESEYLQTRTKLEGLEGRKKSLAENLEGLRLVYQDNYPDIVTIKTQISDIDSQIQAIYDEQGVGASNRDSGDNPLFEDLRRQRSVSEVNLKAQNQRMASLKKLLEQEYVRAQKVAANEATLSELTRDYTVTKSVYEEMLERKESARLSMVLDIEGQGVTYRIHEPPVFPLKPSGLLPLHFAVVAPFIGLMIPIGLAVVYILLDPRIRAYSKLSSSFSDSLEVIGVVPHTYTAIATRILKRDAMILLALIALFFTAYGLVVYYKILS